MAATVPMGAMSSGVGRRPRGCAASGCRPEARLDAYWAALIERSRPMLMGMNHAGNSTMLRTGTMIMASSGSSCCSSGAFELSGVAAAAGLPASNKWLDRIHGCLSRVRRRQPFCNNMSAHHSRHGAGAHGAQSGHTEFQVAGSCRHRNRQPESARHTPPAPLLQPDIESLWRDAGSAMSR